MIGFAIFVTTTTIPFEPFVTFFTNAGNRCSAHPQKPSNLQFPCYKGPESSKKTIKQKDEKQLRNVNDEDFPKVVFLMLGDEGGDWKEE